MSQSCYELWGKQEHVSGDAAASSAFSSDVIFCACHSTWCKDATCRFSTLHRICLKPEQKHRRSGSTSLPSLPFSRHPLLSLPSLVKHLHASCPPSHNAVQDGCLLELWLQHRRERWEQSAASVTLLRRALRMSPIRHHLSLLHFLPTHRLFWHQRASRWSDAKVF